MPHCQICGRSIKANTGVIAHHGYKRPQDWHMQTRSCFGARRQPYEVSCDALDEYILIIQGSLVSTVIERDELISNPPATLTIRVKRDAWDRLGTKVTLDRPSEFDAVLAIRAASHGFQTYPDVFRTRYKSLQQQVAGLTDELAYLRERRASWKVVA